MNKSKITNGKSKKDEKKSNKRKKRKTGDEGYRK